LVEIEFGHIEFFSGQTAKYDGDIIGLCTKKHSGNTTIKGRGGIVKERERLDDCGEGK
jgi:hypothetical protein